MGRRLCQGPSGSRQGAAGGFETDSRQGSRGFEDQGKPDVFRHIYGILGVFAFTLSILTAHFVYGLASRGGLLEIYVSAMIFLDGDLVAVCHVFPSDKVFRQYPQGCVPEGKSFRGYDFRFRDAVGFRGGDKYSRCRDIQEAELRMSAGLRFFLFERMKRYY